MFLTLKHTMKMNKNLIYIRSNTFSKSNIDKAKRMLSYSFPNIIFTQPIISVPSSQAALPFRNILGTFLSETPMDEIINTLKSIEYSLGQRIRKIDNDLVLIELELIQHGDTTLNQERMDSKTIKSLFENLDY